tara:strand:- start:44 stop:169 length:126 start_codon:yes stop_codon:yes gene_type:complete
MITENLNTIPFVLSLSKDIHRQQPHFDKLRTNGSSKGRLFS